MNRTAVKNAFIYVFTKKKKKMFLHIFGLAEKAEEALMARRCALQILNFKITVTFSQILNLLMS